MIAVCSAVSNSMLIAVYSLIGQECPGIAFQAASVRIGRKAQCFLGFRDLQKEKFSPLTTV